VDCFGVFRCWNLIINCIQNLWGILNLWNCYPCCHPCCHNFKLMELLSSAAAVCAICVRILDYGCAICVRIHIPNWVSSFEVIHVLLIIHVEVVV
jgi:hypothetical protein